MTVGVNTVQKIAESTSKMSIGARKDLAVICFGAGMCLIILGTGLYLNQ